jgi:spermidine/putrescine transport system ATP-binding protein
LLLDEPLASLDRKLREDMQLELKQIQERVDITFIYVTHDQKEAISMSDRIAVMNEGKIIQLGSPTEIYERPQARFVADFMGASNIYSAQVLRADGEHINAQTEGGLSISVLRSEERGAPEAEQVSLCIRPEEIKVYPPEAEGDGVNRFDGVIEEKVYQGDFTELLIDLENGEKNVVRLNSDSARELRGILQRGERVLVEWPPEDVALLER